jgi:cytosine/adenosine deaminase-related metal-dependent hydrolase
MATLLLKNADLLLTMDGQQQRISGGGLFARDGVIEVVGQSSDLPDQADEVIDASGMIVLPGLINTHHHLYQTLTRALPGAQDEELFDWLIRLYPVWGELSDEAVHVSAVVGLAEMILSGCTTSTDHLISTDCRMSYPRRRSWTHLWRR